MLEVPVDFGLKDKAGAELRARKEAVLDLLQRDASSEFDISGEIDLPQSAFCVRPEHPKPGRVIGCTEWTWFARDPVIRTRFERGQAERQIRIVGCLLSDGRRGAMGVRSGQRGEANSRIPPMLSNVLINENVHDLAAIL
jgi:hypothetical protein